MESCVNHFKDDILRILRWIKGKIKNDLTYTIYTKRTIKAVDHRHSYEGQNKPFPTSSIP